MVAIEPPARYVFFDGAIVPWADARVHVFSPAVKYGAGVFEGIRGYWNDDHQQMYVFRLAEHMQRLHYSQLMMRFDRIIDVDHVAEQILELVRANHHRETLHIRPNVFVAGYGESGARTPVSLAITAVPRPLPQRVESGCSVQVSAWQRVPDRAMPMRVKANANYNNARFAAVQAQLDGYETALFLNDRGKVSEGPGMCFFMIRDGVPVTPSITSDILESITRDTVLTLSRERLGVSRSSATSTAASCSPPTRRSSAAPAGRSRPSRASIASRSAPARSDRSRVRCRGSTSTSCMHGWTITRTGEPLSTRRPE